MIVKLEFLIEVFFSEIIVLEIMNKLRNAELYCFVSIASIATNVSFNKYQAIDYTICGGHWNTQCMTTPNISFDFWVEKKKVQFGEDLSAVGESSTWQKT